MIAQWFVDKAMRVAERTVIWVYVRFARERGWDERRARAFASRALANIAHDFSAYFRGEKTEVEIQAARLATRFDLGATLNESAERARQKIAEERAATPPQYGMAKLPCGKCDAVSSVPRSPEASAWVCAKCGRSNPGAYPVMGDSYSPKQMAALSVQQRTLSKNLADPALTAPPKAVLDAASQPTPPESTPCPTPLQR